MLYGSQSSGSAGSFITSGGDNFRRQYLPLYDRRPPGHKVRFESNGLKADSCAATISISFDRFSGARQQLCPFGYWWWSSNQFSLSNPSG
jgi:hypothetical protein